jgi:hypothetical protein
MKGFQDFPFGLASSSLFLCLTLFSNGLNIGSGIEIKRKRPIFKRFEHRVRHRNKEEEARPKEMCVWAPCASHRSGVLPSEFLRLVQAATLKM